MHQRYCQPPTGTKQAWRYDTMGTSPRLQRSTQQWSITFLRPTSKGQKLDSTVPCVVFHARIPSRPPSTHSSTFRFCHRDWHINCSQNGKRTGREKIYTSLSVRFLSSSSVSACLLPIPHQKHTDPASITPSLLGLPQSRSVLR